MDEKARFSLVRRRDVTGFLTSSAGLVLSGCGGSEGSESAGSGGTSFGFGGMSSGVGGTSPGAGGANAGLGGEPLTGDGGAGSGGAGSPVKWASGGTASLSPSYPDPFSGNIDSCPAMPGATEGPCREIVDLVRRDISEGLPGLPMRLSLLVVDESCVPIEGAMVKVWHTQISGSYSGEPPTDYPCLLDPLDVTKHYFRGVQTTDAQGRVDFDSCFPGWYPVRAIHIHFTITVGEVEFTSQWGFDQALVDDIYQNQSEYAAYGPPPVSNAGDSILLAVGEAGLLDAVRQDDGALVASTVVVLPG